MKFIIAFILILTSNCESVLPEANRLIIENNSNHSIMYYDATGAIEKPYPDTLIRNEPPAKFIESGKRGGRDIWIEWEEFFSELPSDTLSVFIFHADTIEQNDWETIRNEYKVLKRYDLSLEDLERLEYYISYPPSTEMEGMRMYPR